MPQGRGVEPAEARSQQNITSGGSRDTEVKLPTGPSGADAVTTSTAVGIRPSILR